MTEKTIRNQEKIISEKTLNKKTFNKVLSWGSYLARCDIASKTLDRRGRKKDNIAHSEFINYWMPYFAMLYIVIEAWEELKFKDPQIDQLLLNGKHIKNQLKRLRNAIFHFQGNLLNDKFILFFKEDNSVKWALTLHDCFNRFFYEITCEKTCSNQKLQIKCKNQFKSTLGWYPKNIYDEIIKQNQILKKFTKKAKTENDIKMKQTINDVLLATENCISIAKTTRKKMYAHVDKVIKEIKIVEGK